MIILTIISGIAFILVLILGTISALDLDTSEPIKDKKYKVEKLEITDLTLNKDCITGIVTNTTPDNREGIEDLKPG